MVGHVQQRAQGDLRVGGVRALGGIPESPVPRVHLQVSDKRQSAQGFCKPCTRSHWPEMVGWHGSAGAAPKIVATVAASRSSNGHAHGQHRLMTSMVPSQRCPSLSWQCAAHRRCYALCMPAVSVTRAEHHTQHTQNVQLCNSFSRFQAVHWRRQHWQRSTPQRRALAE